MKRVMIMMIMIMIGVFMLSVGLYLLRSSIYSTLESDSIYLGEKVLVESDTLTILSVNTFSRTYTLSNGIEIDIEFAQKNTIGK